MSAVRRLSPAVVPVLILLATSSGWTQEATGYGQLRAGGTGACLAVDGLSPSSRVLLTACGEPTQQAWRYEATPGRVRFGATDLCLHGRGPSKPGEGGPVRLGPCDDDGAAGWTGTMAKGRLTLKHAGLGLCLDPVGKNTTKAGTIVRLAACGDADQQFAVTRVTPSVSLHDAAGFVGGAKAVTGELDVASGWAGHSVASVRLLDTTAAVFDGPNFTGRCRTLTGSESLLTAPVASVKAGTTCAALGAVDAPPPPETFAQLAITPPDTLAPGSQNLRLRALGLCLKGDATTGRLSLTTSCESATASWSQRAFGDLVMDAGRKCIADSPTGAAVGACPATPDVIDLMAVEAAPGFVHMVQRSSGLCLVASGAVADGGPVTFGECDAGDRALWTWGADASAAPPPDPEVDVSMLRVHNGVVVRKPWRDGVVPVCWEQYDDISEADRDRVRSAVDGSWGAVANITFTGWGKCPAPGAGDVAFDAVTVNRGTTTAYTQGVRILVADSDSLNHPASLLGPTSLADGSGLTRRTNDNRGLGAVVNGDGMAPTMLLNLSFYNFEPHLCRGAGWGFLSKNWDLDNDVNQCIENIAVHEFGHALGFEHEQARGDTPSSCTERQAGGDGASPIARDIGPWDGDSVMNYCNGRSDDSWGFLSPGDIQGAQAVYGPPTPRAILYEHADYAPGGAAQVVEGQVAQLMPRIADKTSSIMLMGTDVVSVYEDANFRGVCETITASQPSFAGSLVGSDEISSVIVGQTCDGSPGGPPVATLYMDASYGGAAIPVWATEIPKLSERGANDAASSIRLGAGVRVASLYQDADFKGTCVTISGDQASLALPGLGNDSLSSVRFNVTCDGLADVPTAGVQLWDDASFAGQPVVLPRDIPDLDARGFHDKASSVKLFGGVTVAALWENDDYTGRCFTVTGDTPQLTATLFGNDDADSVWVGRGCDGQPTPPVNGIRLYQSAGATGPSVLLTTDTPSLAAVGMHDSASSARLEGTTILAAVYQDADYAGQCETISGAVDFSALRIGNDSASSVRVGVDCFGNRTVVTSGVRLFADANFAGASLFAPNHIASLGGMGFGDTTSSIRLEGTTKAAAIYEDANFTGRCQSIYTNTASLAGLVVQGDSASSLKVGVDCAGSPVPPQGGVRVFWDSNYGGESMWVTGSLASVGSHWNDEITSIRFEGTGVSVVALYEDSNYRGDCTTLWGTVAANGTVSGGTASLSGTSVGNDEVTSILIGSPCR